jgi:hypothetical protein
LRKIRCANEALSKICKKPKQPFEAFSRSLGLRWQKVQKAIKGMKKLTARQEAALKRHKEHHTAKHMAAMRRSMGAGKTFKEAHRLAMRKVGR